jgi:hypothetical protein
MRQVIDLRAAKATAKSRYGRTPGVRGFGVGDHSLRVYVSNSSVKSQLPAKINGVPVVVVVTGEISSQKR